MVIGREDFALSADRFPLDGGVLRTQMILVTGSAGLIGRTLIRRLRLLGAAVVEADLRHPEYQTPADVGDPAAMLPLIGSVSGVVHLAAVSRVIEGERNPGKCWTVNVEGTRTLIKLCLAARKPPWLLYASSREVYGQQDSLPVAETAGLKPMNVYARSKLAAERLVGEARHERGLTAGVARFSNVYGDAGDHVDRVVPAFARAAALGGQIRVEGQHHSFDFTHVEDVADGICAMAAQLVSRERILPPIHFVTGTPTTLGELAALAVASAQAHISVVAGQPRSFDVRSFYGDPSRALALLGWRSRVDLRSGFLQLAKDFAERVPLDVAQGRS